MTPAILLAAATVTWAQAKQSEKAPSTAPSSTAPTATRQITALGWLVGGVWTADASRLGPGMQRIETRYQWADNDAFLRFNTHFVFDKGAVKTYDGNFFWNPDQKTLSIWYMNADNEITQGPVRLDGDKMTIAFRGLDFEGAISDMRVVVSRKNNDDYNWALAKSQPDGTRKELASLEYRRIPGS
jgi:hypothetical protein